MVRRVLVSVGSVATMVGESGSVISSVGEWSESLSTETCTTPAGVVPWRSSESEPLQVSPASAGSAAAPRVLALSSA